MSQLNPSNNHQRESPFLFRRKIEHLLPPPPWVPPVQSPAAACPQDGDTTGGLAAGALGPLALWLRGAVAVAAHTSSLTLHRTVVPSPTASPGSSCAGQTLIHGCPHRPFRKRDFRPPSATGKETVHTRAAPVAAEQSLRGGAGPPWHRAEWQRVPGCVRATTVQVRPSQPRHNKATAGWGGCCPARCGPGPVLVRQRDDIVVDARLQLLDLLGRCLGGEDALRLGHRRIRHCCRGGGQCCLQPTAYSGLPSAPLTCPQRRDKRPPCPCGAPAGSPALLNPVSQLTGRDQQISALGHHGWQQNSDRV